MQEGYGQGNQQRRRQLPQNADVEWPCRGGLDPRLSCQEIGQRLGAARLLVGRGLVQALIRLPHPRLDGFQFARFRLLHAVVQPPQGEEEAERTGAEQHGIDEQRQPARRKAPEEDHQRENHRSRQADNQAILRQGRQVITVKYINRQGLMLEVGANPQAARHRADELPEPQGDQSNPPQVVRPQDRIRLGRDIRVEAQRAKRRGQEHRTLPEGRDAEAARLRLSKGRVVHQQGGANGTQELLRASLDGDK